MDPFQFFDKWFWAVGILFALINVLIMRAKAAKKIRQNPELEDGYRVLFRRFFIAASVPWIIMAIGCTVGDAPSSSHFFFRLRDGNPFVLAFWLSIFFMLLLHVHWIYFNGGAEIIAKHPGILSRETDDPVSVKRSGLMFLGGFILLAVVLYLQVIPISDFARELPQTSHTAPAQASRNPMNSEGRSAVYRTVFDIETAGYRAWKFVAPGFLFMVIGSVLVKNRRKMKAAQKYPRFVSILAFYMLGFAILWTTLAFAFTYRDYWRLLSARKDGTASVTEGVVRGFVPMPYSGHPEESFEVNGIRFSYSDYDVTAGFNNTKSHGGPIDEGKHVRVTYVGNAIAKLEVSEKH